MNHSSHVFSGNPLNRGHIERRSEKWLSEATRDHSSRFLLFYGSKVGLLKHQETCLLRTNSQFIDDFNIQTTPIFLGLMNKKAHFVINAEESNIPIKTLCSKFNCSFEEIRPAAEQISKEEASIIEQLKSMDLETKLYDILYEHPKKSKSIMNTNVKEFLIEKYSLS